MSAESESELGEAFLRDLQWCPRNFLHRRLGRATLSRFSALSPETQVSPCFQGPGRHPQRGGLLASRLVSYRCQISFLDRWCGRPLHLCQTIFEGAGLAVRQLGCETACAGPWTSSSPWILGLVPKFWSVAERMEGMVLNHKVCICHGPMVGSAPRHVAYRLRSHQ